VPNEYAGMAEAPGDLNFGVEEKRRRVGDGTQVVELGTGERERERVELQGGVAEMDGGAGRGN